MGAGGRSVWEHGGLLKMKKHRKKESPATLNSLNAAIIVCLCLFIIGGCAGTKETSTETGIQPRDGLAIMDAGEDAHKNGNLRLAITLYTEALETGDLGDNELIETYNNRGAAYADLGMVEDAINDFTRGVEVNDRVAELYNNRGLAYGSIAEYEKAIKDINRAIELNPEYAAAYNNRGNIRRKLKQYDLAIKDFNQALKINPDYASIYANRGLAYGSMKKYDQAISDFTRAIRLVPEFAEGYFYRGYARALNGDLREALADVENALKYDPANIKYIELKNSIKQQLGR